MQLKIALILSLSILGFSHSANADTVSECIEEKASSEKCRYFLKGYLYGLKEAKDNALIAQNGGKAKESFSERAIRTRLGLSGSRLESDYCLPKGAKLREVARVLQDKFVDNKLWAEADDPIGAALAELYPCK